MDIIEHFQALWHGHQINAARIRFHGHPAVVYEVPEDADTMGELDAISRAAQSENPGQRVFACIDAEAYAAALAAGTGQQLRQSNVLELMPRLDPVDVRIDTWSSGCGPHLSQHVRVTHLPTGAVATGASRDEALCDLAERVTEQVMDAYQIPPELREAWDQIREGGEG